MIHNLALSLPPHLTTNFAFLLEVYLCSDSNKMDEQCEIKEPEHTFRGVKARSQDSGFFWVLACFCYSMPFSPPPPKAHGALKCFLKSAVVLRVKEQKHLLRT